MKKLTNEFEKFGTRKMITAIVFAILILIISRMASMVVVRIPIMVEIPIAIKNVAEGTVYIIFTLLGVILLCKKLLKIPLSVCKVTRFRLKPIWCMTALMMPVLVAGIFILTPGHWEDTSMNSSVIYAAITESIFLFGLAGGIVEEMIFRGVIMSALEHRYNKKIAIFVPSILFASLHIIGRELDFLSIIQLMAAGSIVGILFSLITYESGSIWCSAFVHCIWNVVIGSNILSIGVTSNKTAIFHYILDTKLFLLSGGDFGVEASIVSICVYLIFIGLAVHLIRKRE